MHMSEKTEGKMEIHLEGKLDNFNTLENFWRAEMIWQQVLHYKDS